MSIHLCDVPVSNSEPSGLQRDIVLASSLVKYCLRTVDIIDILREIEFQPIRITFADALHELQRAYDK